MNVYKKGSFAIFFTIIFGIIVLAIFGVDLRGYADDSNIQYKLNVVWFVGVEIYSNYFIPPLNYSWQKVLKPYITDPLLSFLI